MQESTSMQSPHGLGQSSSRHTMIRASVSAVVFLAIVLWLAPSVQAQIGNLDWASGEKAVKQKKQVDYEEVKFQFFMEPGVGKAKFKYPEGSESALMLDMGVGGVYQVFRSPGEGVQFDAGLCFSIGSNLPDFDFDGFRLLGVAAPEIGAKLPTSNSLLLRPFLSFGPGLSVLNNGFTYSDEFGGMDIFDFADGDDEKFAKLVWVLRAGIEIGSKTGPMSGVIGVKRIGRGDTEFQTYSYSDGTYRKYKYSETDLLLLLGIRFKFAM